jgi:2-keto-4-pentenoate hydratase
MRNSPENLNHRTLWAIFGYKVRFHTIVGCVLWMGYDRLVWQRSQKGGMIPMSDRKLQLTSVADALREARQTGVPLQNVAEENVPLSLEEAYYVQDAIAPAFGLNGGWKIGAPTPADSPFFAPMPKAWIGKDGDTLHDSRHRLRGVECEIAFLIGKDLPPRDTPYTRDEVVAAIASAHPAIEVLEAGFVDPRAVPRFAMMGDMQMHGGFIPGPSIADWTSIDWAKESVTLRIDSNVELERTASNPAGTDLLRLMVYLANEGSARTGGLHAGDWITTGSWTGATWTVAGAKIDVDFKHAGHVGLRFA